ncbi:hypothetical protein RRF57_004999 [Xylaria bambusicola]|uniref:Uncharacterized protein n=1 Tax=Xylaria bambusicola TaxID=326684 RepID=A0AAN7YXE7_9PEZI
MFWSGIIVFIRVCRECDRWFKLNLSFVYNIRRRSGRQAASVLAEQIKDLDIKTHKSGRDFVLIIVAIFFISTGIPVLE